MNLRATSMSVVLAALASFHQAACGGSVVSEGGAGGSGGTTSSGSTNATGSHASSSGVGSSSGTGAGGSSGDCTTNADCGGKTCAPVTPGGYRICLSIPPEATMCHTPGSPIPEQCCTSAMCNTGKCYSSSNIPYCGGVAQQDHNACIADACKADSDCVEGKLPQVCAPPGAFGRPARECLVAYCHTNADCTAKAGGICAPVSSPCCSVPSGLGCVYPGGCRNDSDCSKNGSAHCELNAEQKAGVCVNGGAPCPA